MVLESLKKTELEFDLILLSLFYHFLSLEMHMPVSSYISNNWIEPKLCSIIRDGGVFFN